MSKPRKSLSQKLRFEVFKRDSFKCQYCGKSAPDAVLRADHIEPHSKGGTDDITNLITSCFDCNAGKGATRLSDQSLMEKTKRQLEELQEKRNQLEAMMQWRKSLASADGEAVKMCAGLFGELAPGHTANDQGLKMLKSWLRTFSFEEVITAIRTACDSYLKTDDTGTATRESASVAFSKIPGICRMGRLDKEQPEMREVYYIRGIIRNRFNLSGFEQHRIINKIHQALDVVEVSDLKAAARNCKSFYAFEKWVEDFCIDSEAPNKGGNHA